LLEYQLSSEYVSISFDVRFDLSTQLGRCSIGVVRRTFDQLKLGIKLDPDSRNLYLDDDNSRLEISTVYFRAGYAAEDYADPSNYITRSLLEQSRAIKCPSIPLQVAGSKKIQQTLMATPGLLEHFLCDAKTWGKNNIFQKEDLDQLRANWMEMWGLDDEGEPSNSGGSVTASATEERFGTRKARQLAPSIVLKPQREGGGNNVFKDDIPAFLDNLPPEKRAAWIAQGLITPPKDMGSLLLRSDEETRVATKAEVVSELGVFGWNLFHPIRGMKEKEVGWLLRTKSKDVNEGGVAAGFSVLDSILLVD